MIVAGLCAAALAHAQPPADEPAEPLVADPAALAFEEGRWEDAIAEYRSFLAEFPDDRLSLLRIAQAERQLGRHRDALLTLEQARTANAPEAMIDFERARNQALLGERSAALDALDSADHAGLRALALLEETEELDALRGEERFRRIHRSVRARVYPCEGMPEASQLDFWVGRWEVRHPDGTLVGYDTITKRDGGCSIVEQWDGAGGSSGTSLAFYVPSRGEWRFVWVGSGATLIDLTGGLVDGVMRMEGTVEYAAEDRVVAFRASWTEGTDGRVRQRMEEFDLAAQTWVLWFDGFFRRVADE